MPKMQTQKDIHMSNNGKKIFKPTIVGPDGKAEPLIRKGDAPGGRWKTQKLDKMDIGDVIGIPIRAAAKFREPFEESAGGELKSMRCHHTESGIHVRYMVLPQGPACLDCMVTSVNEIYPR